MWESYIRDLAVFGANAIELIPPRSDDAADSPHFPLPPMQMMIEMSRLAKEYGLECWIWYQAMDPDYVTPLALYLVSEPCRENGALWSAAAGRYARVAIVVGKGWLAPLGAPPSLEDMAAHLAEISDVSDFDEPMSVVAELATVVAAYRRRGEAG